MFVIVLSDEDGSSPWWWIIDVAFMYHKEAAGFSLSLLFLLGVYTWMRLVLSFELLQHLRSVVI